MDTKTRLEVISERAEKIEAMSNDLYQAMDVLVSAMGAKGGKALILKKLSVEAYSISDVAKKIKSMSDAALEEVKKDENV